MTQTTAQAWLEELPPSQRELERLQQQPAMEIRGMEVTRATAAAVEALVAKAARFSYVPLKKKVAMKRVLAAIPLALLFSPGFARPQSTESKSSQDSQNNIPLDLNGKWATGDGRQVVITHSGSHVQATFVGNNKCANGATLDYALDGELKGTSLTGTMTACTTDPKLITDCGLQPAWTTTFDASAAWDKISGRILIMGIAMGADNGHYVNCHPDPRYDKHQAFTLTYVPCNAKAWADFYRKMRTIDELYDGWLKRGDEIDDEFKENLEHVVLGTSVATGVHVAMDKGLEYGAEKVAEDFWDRAARLESLLKAEVASGVMTVAEKAAAVGYILELAAEGYMVARSYQQWTDAQKAEEEVNIRAADALWKSALDDLRRALSQSEECKRDREKAKDSENLNDKAHELMDKWEIDGRNLYKDASGEILNAAAAFKKAKEILTANQSGRLSGNDKPQLVAYRGPAQEGTVTLPQLKEAIAQTQEGSLLWKKGMEMIVVGINEQTKFRQALKEIQDQTKSR